MDESEIAKFLDQSKSTSVSKGCFAYKGKKKNVVSASYFSDGDAKSSRRRLELYNQHWTEISSSVQKLQNDANTTIFDDVLKYAKQAYPDEGGERVTSFMREIPTAALLTGVNMPDHDVLFSSLTRLLRDEVSPHIALLKSEDCSSIKQLTQNVIEQITAEDPQGANIKRSNPTISTLAKWYDEHTSSSPSKKRRTSSKSTPTTPSGKRPVIIILEDLERFNPVIVQDFVMACSNHLEMLPVILVLGVATAVTTIHRLLPQSVSSLLSVDKFQAAPSSGHFTNILGQTVMTSSRPFKLGGRVFQQLVDIFLMHDFSVNNYTSSLQFLLMDHFHANKASILCCAAEETESSVDALNEAALNDIRQCPSFMRFVETAAPETQQALLLDDAALKKHIKSWVSDLHQYQENFFPVLECLHAVTSQLPRHPLGRQIREVYGRCLESSVFDQEDYKTCFALLRTLSRDNLVRMLETCIGHVIKYDARTMNAVTQELSGCVEKFAAIDENAVEELEEEPTAEAVTVLPKKMDMMALRKRLKDMAGQKKRLTVYEVLRQETLDYLDGLFKRHLFHYKLMPLHEAFHHESSVKVRQHVNASPRTAMHLALTNPQHYLKNDLAYSEMGSISKDLPDLSIAFKLHLECGRLINLYDWLQAFVTIVTSGKKAAKQTDKTLQARFIRSVCELQFLGFLKSTKRKTDHVQRLTYGGC